MTETQLETPTERVAAVMVALARGTLTTRQIMRITGLTRAATYNLMWRLSRTQPIVLEHGLWRLGVEERMRKEGG